MDRKLRVLLADDHTIIRRGIAELLSRQADMEVVGEAGDGWEAAHLAEELRPDIILMDVAMPRLSGIEATRTIVSSWPEARILILTIHDRDDYLFRALQAGAAGYLLKDADVDELLQGIRVVAAGDAFVSPRMTSKLVADYVRQTAKGNAETLDSLTKREREVLPLLADGKTVAEVARILVLSPHTVQTHRDHIMEKLNLHGRSDLLKYAIRKGIIELDP